MIYLLIVLISYMMGSISGAIIVSYSLFKEDIRLKGSGNAGSTNVFRNYGIKYAALAFIIDSLKGILAPLIAYYLDSQYGQYIAGVVVVIGHVWPIYYGFKGGKGMATSIGVNIYTDYRIAILQGIGFLIFNYTVKIVSVASLALTILAFVYVLIVHNTNIAFVIMSLLNTIIVIYSHRENIKRLIEGKEKKIKRMDV
ncbi:MULTISPECIES: glycerol-3-phosphate 1-O-acyltransferase PlsY [Helcococcus]|uniref:Glycerol-3-phosphate acyltransferase n=2 Tax=Helcococcus bovis TaxID=3153252 RepID=A0ABW9F4R4_9FIRM